MFFQPAFVSAEENSFPPFEDAVQDGQGMVWALEHRNRGQLHTFDGQRWDVVRESFKPEDEALPVRLLRLPDGGVACVWRLTNERLAITRYAKGETSVIVPAFEEKRLPRCEIHPGLQYDTHGQYWLSGGGPVVDRIGADGRVAYSYQIQPDQCLMAYDSGRSYDPLPYPGVRADGTLSGFSRGEQTALHTRPPEDAYNPILTTEDGRGRMWAWTYARSTNRSTLDGVLIFDGEKVEQQREFHGMIGKSFTFVGRKDAKHMWVCARNEGLFEVDIDTFEAKHAGPTPRMAAFANVGLLFAEGEDWYAATDGARGKGDLWRLRGGKWTQIIAKLDENNRDVSAVSQRARLSVEKGFILRSCGAAPWFVSPTDPPVRLDWRSDYKIADTKRIFMMNDGTLLALGPRGAVFHGKVALPPKPAPPSRVVDMGIAGGWCGDDEGHLWCILEDQPESLSEWTGEKWEHHALPEKMRSIGAGPLAVDTRRRIWMLSIAAPVRTAYYDTRDGKWGTFPNMEEAFAAVKDDPPRFEREKQVYDAPAVSADGKRMAFLNRSMEICYFDGSAWHHWKRGADFAPGGNAMDPPYFNADGRLCTTIGGATWQMDETGSWHQMTAQPSPSPTPATLLALRRKKIDAPEGCITNSPESIAEDNRGICWLTWKGKLYKAVPGACVEVFSDDEQNPFVDGRRILSAWADPRGNVFFKTGTHTSMMLSPKAPPPKVSVAMENIAADSATAVLSAGPSTGVQFRWQLDGGPWRETKEKKIALNLLANGPHTLSVSAFDAELQTSQPASVKFDIHIDAREQTAALIKQLADPDLSKRKAAVEALANQPTPALQALKDARTKASDDQRWWIDVAIQEIGLKPRPAPTAGGDEAK